MRETRERVEVMKASRPSFIDEQKKVSAYSDAWDLNSVP